MIILDCEQGTEEWHQARLGIPTASMFRKILTPTGADSTQAEAYMHELLGEWLTGQPSDDFVSEWMKRGTELEPEARAYYAFHSGEEVTRIGFLLSKDRKIGASPDLMVGKNGLCEIKAPKDSTHIGYLLQNKLPTKYIPQVQGQLLIAERDWADFLSYHPRIPAHIMRVHRDEKYILKLKRSLKDFNEKMEAKRQILINRGITPMEIAA